jgi:hypothetical protein
MPISDIDQDCRPRSRRRGGLCATAIVLGVALISLEMPEAGARAELAVPSSQAEHSQGGRTVLPPSAEVTSSIGILASPKTATQPSRTSNIPARERITLISLLALCFGAMAYGGFRLWRRSVDDLIRARSSASARGRG